MVDRAIKAFKGAVLTISHNQTFVREVANERWMLEGGSVTFTKDKDSAAESPPDEEEADGDAVAGGAAK